MIKKIGVLLVAVLFVSALASAQAEFGKGRFILTPQIGFASWGGGIPLGVNVEYGIAPNLGVAGTVMAQFWSETFWSQSLISIAGELNLKPA